MDKLLNLVIVWIYIILLSPLDCRRLGDGSMLTRFRNLSNRKMNLWWVTPGYKDEEIRFFGSIPANGGGTSFTSYHGHEFFWSPVGKEREIRLDPFKIVPDQILYIFDDESSDRALQYRTEQELNFLADYFKETGKHWLSPYQRPPPELPYVTVPRQVTSNQYFWTCPQYRGDDTDKCRDKVNLPSLTVEMIHDEHPKVFQAKHFISPTEADHLIRISQRFLRRSMVGDGSNARQDPTRTSSNTWLSMNHTKIVETIYRRVGDLLGFDSDLMTAEAATEHKHGVASHMEVVRFQTAEHYAPHYDNAPKTEIYLHFVTLQIILRTADNFAGGKTQFPRATHSSGSMPDNVEVVSEPLSVLWWYNLVPDGNLDEASMYAHAPVLSGEQWMAHVSIWDPSLPDSGDPRMPHNRVYTMHDEL